ncbi:DUF5677 domain-containing protein [Paenibacillus sp. NPDC058071]|uniref:DUF5677 domain-containing protein n=1 Tax=Paenibacillus sp. NPDC058071 TaxID=3346326 RepID=UPI0036DC1698
MDNLFQYSNSPISNILNRDPDYIETLKFLSEKIDKTVNIGTHFLNWAASIKSDDLSKSTILFMFRKIISDMDGMSILIASGNEESCRPIQRRMLEGSLALLYILKEDTYRRAMCYQVGEAKSKIRTYRKLLKSPNPKVDLKWGIKNMENMLKRKEYKAINTEWNAIKEKNKYKYDPLWYSLFNGPTNVRELNNSAFTGMSSGEYNVTATHIYAIYQELSEDTHFASSMKEMHIDVNGAACLNPLRNPIKLQTTIKFILIWADMVYKAFLGHFIPDKLDLYMCFRKEFIIPTIIELNGKSIFSFESKKNHKLIFCV